MTILDDSGTTVVRKTAEYKPLRSWRTFLFGRPMPTADAPNQTIGKAIGLAVFAADALSSVVYAPQETMVILAAAGTAGFAYALPIAIAVTILLTIVTISYQQTVHAYPNGGGAYIVARDNLGDLAALVASSALLLDYLLLAAVATCSGVAQIVSVFPSIFPYRVLLGVILVLLVMMANLRGVKESGITFAIPNYFFLVMTIFMVLVALFRYFSGSLGPLVDPPPFDVYSGSIQTITVFLVLRAFANGTTALTGVECISNGVQAFKEPRARNAGITMIWMSIILGTLFISITFLLGHIGAIPSEEESVISELARTAYGNRGLLYILTMAGTTIILVLATNTAFADFPRLSAFMANDGYMPRQLAYRGSRLVYSRGIVGLGVIACILIIIFKASVTALMPLWAVGVFVSFTLSQLGMARRWWKIGHMKPGEVIQERNSTLRHESGYVVKLLINGTGALVTAVVSIIFAATKFREGAWFIVMLIPTMVIFFFAVHKHYQHLAAQLSLSHYGSSHIVRRHRVILLISGVHRGSLAALDYARLLSDDVTCVHVSINPVEAQQIQDKWEIWGQGVRLVILDSPYRLMVEPLLEYIEMIMEQRQPNEIITVVVPQFIPKRTWTNFLHTQTATWLRLALMFKPGIVVTDVPYVVES